MGVVLYEMVTGRKPFEGKSQVSLMAAILEREPPPMSAIRSVSPSLDRIVRTCLAKDPDDRFQTAREVLRELRWAEQEKPAQMAAPAPTPAAKSSRAAWVLATVFIAASVALGIAYVRALPEPAKPIHVSIPETTGVAMAISPDGENVALIARGSASPAVLKIRSIHDAVFQEVAGSEGAQAPFWSPDSRWVAFFAQGKLKKVDLLGGRPQVICDVGATSLGQNATSMPRASGTWNRESTILFGVDTGRPLYRVSASGGPPQAATTIDTPSQRSHFRPFFLPDGQHFLFLIATTNSSAGNTGGIHVGSLDSIEVKPIFPDLWTTAQFISPGSLLYLRDGALFAQPFDPSRLEVSGDPVQIVDAVNFSIPTAAFSSFSASDVGTLDLPNAQ